MTAFALACAPAWASCESAESRYKDIACATQALDAADVKLNETYRQLMASLDAEGQNLLRESQRAWVTFRDSEAALERQRSGEGGSLGGLIFINKKLDLTVSRTEELAKVAR